MQGLEQLGVFDSVLDVGGNIGGFADQARQLWPAARITSFEPIPNCAKANRRNAANRWTVHQVAISDRVGKAALHFCENQPSASTMEEPGGYRASVGIVDRFTDHEVQMRPLDYYQNECVVGELLVKVDVEGHEAAVLAGARQTLSVARAVIVECNQDPDVFRGAPTPANVDRILRLSGLSFGGVLASYAPPDGRGPVVQFDAVWLRYP